MIKNSIKYSMRIRLFVLLSVLVLTMLIGLFIIFLITGNINIGLKESEKFIINNHDDVSAKVKNYYENTAAEVLSFSKIVSLDIESKLAEKQFTTDDLTNNPSLLSDVISDELNQVMLYLNRSKSSGAFIILNATVNDKLPDSEYSKAGIYLKNLEPNIVNSTSPTIYMLMGNPNIAYNNNIPLHPNWKMEFNVKDSPYYSMPMDFSTNKTKTPKLYYWSPRFTLPGTYEEIMTCTAPLRDSNGNVFGVCGLDISSMLFKLSFMPDKAMFERTFSMLSPVYENRVNSAQSMIAADYTAKNILSEDDITISNSKKKIYSYKNGDKRFSGYHDYIKLYPEDSVFSDEKWILSVMVPENDVSSYVMKTNLRLLAVCFVLMMSGILISFIISKYYIKPIHNAINIIKQNPGTGTKTNIPEFDDLIECISAREESDPDSLILNEFLNNLRTLSPSERAVFNLYAEDYSAREIAGKLFLSINTIKTHTKHIYAKLDIKSKDELLLYVEMLKESGKKIT